MDFLDFMFKGKEQIEPKRFNYLKRLFSEKEFDIMQIYESKLCQLGKMNTALIIQLREYLAELMRLNAALPHRFAQLVKHDKIINDYVMEDECKTSLFQWIQDFKDYEIRNALQKEIETLKNMLAIRDNEIIELMLKLEQFELKFLTLNDEANFQSGLSGSYA